MIKTRLKYCVFDPDPNGNPRYYVRKPGRAKVRIKETFEARGGTITPEFMKAYFAALATMDGQPTTKTQTPREKTLYWLVDQYFRSGEFARFDPKTQADKRGVLNRYCESGGELPYAALRKVDIERSRDKRSGTPGAADKLVKYLRAAFKWAVEKNHATHNPALGISKINEGEGWHAWTDAEVQIYRDFYPVGTKGRLALELMMNVGARISDASRIGRQHETAGWLKFIAWKNRNRKSRKTIECPIMPELRECLETTPVGDLTYLVSDHGKPFTIDGLGNKMRDWCDAAGLPQCSAHGLRKAAAIYHAERGSTAPEMCALFGWSKLETAETYIREAQKKKMVGNAFARLDEYRNRESVSVMKANTSDETKRRKRHD